MNKPELLSPAGSLSKLKTAIMYGADAVYIGGEAFSLRVAAENFSIEEIKEGIKFAHDCGKKVYVAANVIAHNDDIENFVGFAKLIQEIGVDAVIVADMGMFSIAKEHAPDVALHISTQANITNYQTANMWYQLGAKRVILARELSYKEIKIIRENTPVDLEIEVFVQGAMCISYSGRCLLSNYMTSRDSNQGNCAQSCRWKYHLVEELRPGEYMPVEETDRGTFIFNSKDLCLIEHMKELYDCGVNSVKIEGRVKTEYYVAVVTKIYREELDNYFEQRENYVFYPKQLEELQKVSHRLYTKGFFMGKPDGDAQIYTSSSYIRYYDVVALVKEFDSETKIATLEQRNRFFAGDELEVIQPGKPFFVQKAIDMIDERGRVVEVANHAEMIIKMPFEQEISEYAIIRKVREEA